MITQGDLFWLDTGPGYGSTPAYMRPWVVVQNNTFNLSAMRTTVVCALTTNLERASNPGNVLLRSGEANLPQQSVVLISQMMTVDKQELTDYIGALSAKRINEIVAGIRQLLDPRVFD